MIQHRQGFASRFRNRIAGCLLGSAVCVLLAGPADPALAGPYTAVAPGGQSSLPASERSLRWLAVVDRIDSQKFRRIWQCMQLAGAPIEFTEAINICAPCVSASQGASPAALGGEVRDCVNRRRSQPSRGGGQSAGNGPNDPTAGPQCSGVNPNGPRADGASEDAQREYREARRAERRAYDSYQAARAIEGIWTDAIDRWTRTNLAESDQEPSAAAEAELERLHEHHERAAAVVRDREATWQRARDASSRAGARVVVESGHRGFVDRAADWIYYNVFRHLDPPSDPTGQNPQGAGYEDPRCEGKRQAAAWGAMWSDVCRGEDGHLVDYKECHRRMTDPVYTATNGRCRTEPSPAGGNRTVCQGQENEGRPSGQTPGDGAGANVTDPTPWRQPNRNSARLGPVPNPLQGIEDEMCAKGRCPDPVPFSGNVDRGSNGNARRSDAGPRSNGNARSFNSGPRSNGFNAANAFKPNGRRLQTGATVQTQRLGQLGSTQRQFGQGVMMRQSLGLGRSSFGGGRGFLR